MRTLILSLMVTAVLTQPSIAQTQPSVGSTPLPACHDGTITAPVAQTQISMADSYPPMSIVLNEEGDTIVAFTVKGNGTVADVKVEYGSGSLRLDDAAAGSVRQILYSPAKRGGNAIDCHNQLMIRWRLTDGPAFQAYRPTDAFVLSPPKSLYPAKALAEHREGATVIGIRLGPDSRLINAEIVKSSGSDNLDAASIAYVKTLTLSPAKVDGKPALSAVAIVVAWSVYPAQAAKQAASGSKP